MVLKLFYTKFNCNSNISGTRMLSKAVITKPQFIRKLSYTPISYAKKDKKSKHKSLDVEESDEVIDVRGFVKDATNHFNQTLESHKKKLNEIKSGFTNPNVFNNLKIGKENHKFTDLATTSVKGRNSLLVTVFDPKHTRNVISAIMAAGLNLNPERIPNNEQQLKISLPPVTTESRLFICKELKKTYEEFKNSSSKVSLGYTRAEIMKTLKQFDKKNDNVKKVIQDIEKLHKTYINKLEEQLKQAEKSVMN